ncbi:threonine ammonia-lyase [Aciditerrimonas ferrireducens]|uniref:threonine ammonia-lyase n=1 Tax=Aciditerrimonas ferrireducens TaxID=667306 RepID=A0ABV6C2Y6_9ACTN
MLPVEDIDAARSRLRGVLRPTLVFASESLARRCGRPVLLKPEHRQRTGSFKVRGAYNRIAQLPPTTTGVAAASAGNHAQGVAYAAARVGLPALIVMPESAALPKVAATQAYGAEVRLHGDSLEDAIALAQALAEEQGLVFIPPFDHPAVVAGQGTVGLELAEEAAEAEVVLVPAGGGGLLGGTAAALAARSPSTTVVGVQAAGAPSLVASLAAGRPVQLDQVATVADGIAVKGPSALTLELVRRYVAEVVTVEEEEIAEAVLLLLERTKQVVEPSGAVGLAALLAGKVPGGGPACVVLSGGNVDPLVLSKLVDHGLSAAGRYLVVRVRVTDRPGGLAALTAELAQLRVNVLSVEHHRAGLSLPVDQVEVLLTLETRGPEHARAVLAALQAAGFSPQEVSPTP